MVSVPYGTHTAFPVATVSKEGHLGYVEAMRLPPSWMGLMPFLKGELDPVGSLSILPPS